MCVREREIFFFFSCSLSSSDREEHEGTLYSFAEVLEEQAIFPSPHTLLFIFLCCLWRHFPGSCFHLLPECVTAGMFTWAGNKVCVYCPLSLITRPVLQFSHAASIRNSSAHSRTYLSNRYPIRRNSYIST